MKPVALSILLLASLVTLLYGMHITPQEILAWAKLLRTNHAKTPLFIILNIALCFVSLPLGVFSKLISGWLFGFLPGAIISHLSLLLGSWLAFRTSRYLGRDFVTNRFGKRLDFLNQFVKEHELLAVVRIRIFPFIPLPTANLCLGITSVSDFNFLVGGLIGMLPAVLFYAYIGNEFYQNSFELQSLHQFRPYYLYISLMLIVSLLFPLIQRKMSDKKKQQT